MQIRMIGVVSMGGDMVRRLIKNGHDCVVYGQEVKAVNALEEAGAVGSNSLANLVGQLSTPRTIWMMVPAGVVDSVIEAILPLLSRGDILIDGGNSHYHDSMRRHKALKENGIHYLDVGTSGGVWGLERGYCLMIGGDKESVDYLDPVFASLAPGIEAAPKTLGRKQDASTAEKGYLYCGQSGAGHFVKMVHNGIEYGLMAAYSEGLSILKHANIGSAVHDVDAETTPLRVPEHYQYEFNLTDIAEVWRRGSVITSWLLDLSAQALAEDANLDGFAGHVSDSGEGRWTVNAAVDTGVPAPVLSAALFQRFSSRGEGEFSNRLLSAMRFQFGGHHEKTPKKKG